MFRGVDENPQPQAVDLEIQVLGGLLFLAGAQSGGVVEAVLAKLKPEHFFLKRNGKVYRTIQRLWEQERPIDPMTVTMELAKADPDRIDEIKRYLADELFGAVVSPGMVDSYADIVIEKAYRREVIRQAVALVDLAVNEQHEPDAIRDHIETKLLELLTRGKSGGRMLSESMPDVLQQLEDTVSSGVVPGVPTPFDNLNGLLNGGFRRGQLIVVAGRPSMGKSAFAVGDLLPWIASVTGKPSIVFSLEMSEEELIHRYWSSRMGDPGAISRLDFRPSTWSELGGIVSEMANIPIAIDDTPKVSIDYVKSEARKFKAAHGAIGCIVIDYLQIMDYGKSGNPVQAIANITSSLKALAKELNTPIILLSQLSRGVESRDNKRPFMSDLRDSGSIEQDANIVLMLYRDDYYNPDSDKPGITEIIVAKNRGGAKGTIELQFDAPRTTFRVASTSTQSTPPPDKASIAPIGGFAIGDRVVVAPPEWMAESVRGESAQAAEAPYGKSGTVMGFAQGMCPIAGQTIAWVEVQGDHGEQWQLDPDYLQPDF
jgi:replicative DNA helicase